MQTSFSPTATLSTSQVVPGLLASLALEALLELARPSRAKNQRACSAQHLALLLIGELGRSGYQPSGTSWKMPSGSSVT